MPYRDNVHSISLSRTAADEGLQRIQEDLLAMGCIPYEEVEATGYFQTLGGIVDGEAGQIKPTPTRAWNVLLAFKDCFVSKVGWQFMQRLLGERQTGPPLGLRVHSRGGGSGSSQWSQPVGKEVSIESSGEPVCHALQEGQESLPGCWYGQTS